ncbi:MAG: hypothetical protein Q8Q10_04105 [bacterium]|nr:hypothetical protein [bacterium]
MKKITESPFKAGDIVCVCERTDEAVNWFIGRINSVVWVPMYDATIESYFVPDEFEKPSAGEEEIVRKKVTEVEKKGNWHQGVASVTLYTEPVLATFLAQRGNPYFGEALWRELYPSTVSVRRVLKKSRLSWLLKPRPMILYPEYPIPPETILLNRLERAHPHPEKLLVEVGRTVEVRFEDLCPADPWNFRSMFEKNFFSTHPRAETS